MANQEPAPITSGTQAAAARRGVLWLLGLLLVGAVVCAGSPALNAPWIQGDEHIFIVNNPDVTGAGATRPTGFRWLDIFLHLHEDLYQPVTILTYAVEWSLWPEHRVLAIRLTDVLIHALNALLLWAVLLALLKQLHRDGYATTIVAWALALVWALHPMLVGAYTADMGRTHLLAATFVFLSLLLHLRSLRPGGWPWFAAALFALLLAMLNKPMVGWVIVVFALEWIVLGLRRTLTSPRVYLVGLMCTAFALLTLWTTKRTLLVEDSPLPLFGDPVARAALGLWIYLRNFLWPFNELSFWYPPNIHTGWSYPLVWLGTAAIVLAVVGAVLAARWRNLRGVALGLVWFLAMWLPVSGLVGARVLAAQDRYMYQPMVGLLLVVGVGLLAWTGRERAPGRRRGLVVLAVASLLGLAALPWDRYLCRISRSTVQRAARAVKLNPNDPRVMEFLATAYSFSRNHPTLEERLPSPPDPTALFEETLTRAQELAEKHPEYFRDAHDHAAFCRRLSFEWWKLGGDYERLFELAHTGSPEAQRLLQQAQAAGIDYNQLPEHARQMYERSLALAQRAHDFEPKAMLTWVRLAHAYRALGRFGDARAAYETLKKTMPADAPDRGLRLVEYADLLLNRFDDPAAALPQYRAALAVADLPRDARRVALLGAARCEVLAGKGVDGYELALAAFRAEPDNLEAARIIALYYLRSHRWEDADRAYRGILQRYPADYEALRGFQNVCASLGHWRDAAAAWQDARDADPNNLILRSHFVWAAACAGEEQADAWADALLDDRPDNRFACLAKMLLAIRAGALDQAYEWIQRARQGPRLPLAREFVRAEATLGIMIERHELDDDAVILRGALWAEIGDVSRGQRLIREYLETRPQTSWRPLAERILTEDLRADSAP